MWPKSLTGRKNCLNDVKKWFSANKLMNNKDKTEFCFNLDQRFNVKTYLAIASLFLMLSGTLVYALIVIFKAYSEQL